MKATVTRFLRRGLAYVIDSILVFLFIRPEFFASIFFGRVSTWGTAILEFVTILLTAAYIVGCHWRWGRTVGKRIFGLRVATVDGFSPPPFKASWVRFAPWFAVGVTLFAGDWLVLPHWRIGLFTIGNETVSAWRLAPLVWIISEAIVAFQTEGYRSIHDIIAGTVVTDESAKKKTA